MTLGSVCNTPLSCHPKSGSALALSACRFSTISTSRRPSRSAASSTAERARSASPCSRHRSQSAACVARSSPATSVACRRNLARQVKQRLQPEVPTSTISWLSSMNRTGIRDSRNSSFARSSAATRASSMVLPRPRGATTSACWQDARSRLPRTMSRRMPNSVRRTANCSTISASDWSVPGLNLRTGPRADSSGRPESVTGRPPPLFRRRLV